MSTETTNKKIKIDNGTTFGRTYTDKAVDELLKNVGGGKLEGLTIDVSNTYNPETKEFSGTLTDEQWSKVQNEQIYWIEVVYISSQDASASANFLYNGPFFGEGRAFSNGDGSMMIIIDKSVQGMIIKTALTIDTQGTPTSQVIPSITTSNEQQNLTIGNGLEIKDGALKTKDLEMAVSITATISDLQNAVNSFSNISYNEGDEAEINSFIKNQKGIMKLTIATPVGNLYMTLRPTLWKDDDANSYNFEGSLYIETDLSAIGGSTFNQIIVRAVTWDNGEVSFRPTILPIFDAIGDINTILDNINGEVI